MNIDVDPKCVPEGWEFIAIRKPKLDDCYWNAMSDDVQQCTCDIWGAGPRLILRKLPKPAVCELGEIEDCNWTSRVDFKSGTLNARVSHANGDIWIGTPNDPGVWFTAAQQLALAAILTRTGNGGTLAKPN